jgi:PhnB protein
MTEDHTQQTAGNPALAPYLVCAGAAEAIDFYKQAFGAEELMRLETSDGKIMHAGLTINGAMVMLMDEQPEYDIKGPQALGGSPVTLNLGVDDADAWAERALAAGATLAMPVEEQFWGDRYGVVADPFGHLWALVTPVREMSVEEMKAAAPEDM